MMGTQWTFWFVDEIEHFFISYNEMRSQRFKPIRRAGVKSALELLRRGMRKFEAQKKQLP
jgi:hypothetical protein